MDPDSAYCLSPVSLCRTRPGPELTEPTVALPSTGRVDTVGFAAHTPQLLIANRKLETITLHAKHFFPLGYVRLMVETRCPQQSENVMQR